MNSEIEFETIQSKSVWNVMMNISNMKHNGGILITNDDDRIEVIKAILENNRVIYLQEDGKENSIHLLSIKEARPLTLDHELPTRRDEAPIDDRDNDKEFTPEFHPIEFQGGDIMQSRLSSRKDYRSYDVNIPPPSKLKRSEACYDCLTKKRKLEESTTPILDPSENALLEFPESRPPFLEPSPRVVRIVESEAVEMITKSEYNKLEDDFARLLKLMFNNNYSILQDACESGYKVKIRDSTAQQRIFSVEYTFEKKDEKFVILKDDNNKTLHMDVQDIITVIPSINQDPKTYLNNLLNNLNKPFYEGEIININNEVYWNFKPSNINGDDVFVHEKTGIVVSMSGEMVMFEAVLEDKNYTYEQIYKIKEWVEKCGICVYPTTPRKKREVEIPLTPRKNKYPMYNRKEVTEVSRKLNFDTPKKNPSYLDMVVDGIKEMKQRGGCSRYLIKHYIDKKYNKDNDDALRRALKRGVEDGILVQNKQSFKLSSKQPSKKASLDYDEYFKKPDVKEALKEACKNNKSIFIKYSKGSIPDVKRPIKVIGFQNGENGNDLVVAECLIEGSIRKFKLEHIEIVA